MHIAVQKFNMDEGGVPSELDGIMTIEAFKDLGEGVVAMGPEEEDVIDNPQSEVGLSNTE